jgi:uncharacterized RDD family membrane protein YckC
MDNTQNSVVTSNQQNDVQGFKYAEFVDRVASYLIDYVILQILIMIAMIILFVPFFIILAVLGASLEGNEDLQGAVLTITMLIGFGIITLILIAISWFYYAMQDSSEKQGTLGKQFMKLKVTDYDGNRINFTKASVRFFATFLNSFIFSLGYLFPLFTEKKQTLHDMVAGVVVLKDK